MKTHPKVKKQQQKNTVTFEYEFVIDHEDFQGVISCSKTITTTRDINNPAVCEQLYSKLATEACDEFIERFQLIQGE